MNYNCISPYIRRTSLSTIYYPCGVANRIILDYELLFVEEGGCLLTVNGTEYRCKQNDIILLRPGIPHSIQTVEGMDFKQPHIHFDLCYDEKSPDVFICFKTLDQLTENEKALLRTDMLDIDIPPVFQMPDTDYFKALFLETVRLFQSKNKLNKLKCKEKFLRLLHKIFEQYDTDYSLDEDRQKVDLLAIKNYIDSNFKQDITLDRLSSVFFINKFHLEEIFKKQFGTSVIKYVNHVRFNAACELLQKNKNVGTVAEELGYKNIYTFSRFFKNHCGLSPLQYKKTIQ